MAENKLKGVDAIVLAGVVLLSVLICNLLTPYLYRSIKTDKYRTTLLLNKLSDPEFKPDIVVFGSSKSMAGIDCYQMSAELGQDAYNFSSTGQPAVESSLYYSLLPSSVKTVVQIIYPPIKEENGVGEDKLSKNIAIPFSMGGYRITPETEDINPLTDFSELKKNRFLQNFDARGAIIIPGLTYILLPKDKEASEDLKFCNFYLTSRHQMYERTIEQLKVNSHIGQEIHIDSTVTGTLEKYAQYLGSKGIKMVVVLMPSNPDTMEFSNEQMEMIGDACRKSIPDALVLNYLSAIQDTQLFYDAAHLNKDGAKMITALIDKDLMAQINIFR